MFTFKTTSVSPAQAVSLSMQRIEVATSRTETRKSAGVLYDNYTYLSKTQSGTAHTGEGTGAPVTYTDTSGSWTYDRSGTLGRYSETGSLQEYDTTTLSASGSSTTTYNQPTISHHLLGTRATVSNFSSSTTRTTRKYSTVPTVNTSGVLTTSRKQLTITTTSSTGTTANITDTYTTGTSSILAMTDDLTGGLPSQYTETAQGAHAQGNEKIVSYSESQGLGFGYASSLSQAYSISVVSSQSYSTYSLSINAVLGSLTSTAAAPGSIVRTVTRANVFAGGSGIFGSTIYQSPFRPATTTTRNILSANSTYTSTANEVSPTVGTLTYDTNSAATSSYWRSFDSSFLDVMLKPEIDGSLGAVTGGTIRGGFVASAAGTVGHLSVYSLSSGDSVTLSRTWRLVAQTAVSFRSAEYGDCIGWQPYGYAGLRHPAGLDLSDSVYEGMSIGGSNLQSVAWSGKYLSDLTPPLWTSYGTRADYSWASSASASVSVTDSNGSSVLPISVAGANLGQGITLQGAVMGDESDTALQALIGGRVLSGQTNVISGPVQRATIHDRSNGSTVSTFSCGSTYLPLAGDLIVKFEGGASYQLTNTANFHVDAPRL